MEIAYGECDITPGLGEELSGYGFYLNRRAERTLDPLCCRVCAFKEGERSALLVQLDLLGLQADHVGELRARLGRVHHLPPEAVLFHCTHTHTGPASIPLFGCGESTRTLRGFLTKHIMETVAEALKTWQPIHRARWFEREFEGIAYNRDTANGPVDHRVRGLLLEPQKAAPVVIVNYACHPVALGVRSAYSADYPGAVARCLAASGYRCVFLVAPCGDLDPLVSKAAWGKGTEETLRFYGQRIAAAVEQGIASGEEAGLEGLRFGSQDINLIVEPPSREDCVKMIDEANDVLEKDPTDGLALSTLEGARHWLEMLDDRRGEKQPVEVQAMRLGDVAILGIAAELFSELAAITRERSRVRRVLMAGTCNGLVGYIPTRRSIDRRSYAAWAAPRLFGVFPQRPGAGEQFAADSANFLAELMTDSK